MSIKLMSMVWDRLNVSGGMLNLALALADHADDLGGSLYPSADRLARRTRQHERHVRRQLKEFRDMQWLLVVAPGGRISGVNTANRYQINPLWIAGQILPRIPELPGGQNVSPVDMFPQQAVEKRGDKMSSPDMSPQSGVTFLTGRGGAGAPLSVMIHQEPLSTTIPETAGSVCGQDREEVIRAARALVAAHPNYPEPLLRKVFGLDDRGVAEVLAPSAAYSEPS